MTTSSTVTWLEQLSDHASPKRRTAAKHLGKLGDATAGPQLLDAFLKERQDSRTWETQAAMATALGLLHYAPAAEELLAVTEQGPEHDFVSTVCATAYSRIVRSSLKDASPVLRLLGMKKFSVSMGALLALGCDRMVPPNHDILSILEFARPLHHQKGFGDPRYGAAIAASGWDLPEVNVFLKECLQSQDSGVVTAAQYALKKQYSKCR